VRRNHEEGVKRGTGFGRAWQGDMVERVCLDTHGVYYHKSTVSVKEFVEVGFGLVDGCYPGEQVDYAGAPVPFWDCCPVFTGGEGE
jgi:hypothetical protein